MTAAVETPARVTPDGVLLGSPEPESDEWFRLRRGGVTATDLPRILDLSPYGNARSVWHDKRGELPREEGGEAAHWGHLLEDVVAQEWARRHARDGRAQVVVVPIGVIANAAEPWMRCALDRLVLDGCPVGGVGRICALEVKTRSAYVAGRWRDDVPDDVLAQVAWQRRVTGLDHIHIACLLGGQKLIEHRYERDDDLEAYLAGAAGALWRDVLNGTPPPVDMTGVLADLLDALNPDRAGEKDVDDDTARRLLDAHLAARDAEKAAERQKEAARALVLSELGDAEVLTSGGSPIFTYRQQTKTSINVRDLEDNDVELYEQVLAGGHITETTSRVLRAAKRGATDGK
ncbi:MAG TPA: YqaJ viral recombinase family protein [Micromonosporaceae bacterium]|nr:YqaJ viral recombinase family protein [Micromonosporaceae bacterium]